MSALKDRVMLPPPCANKTPHVPTCQFGRETAFFQFGVPGTRIYFESLVWKLEQLELVHDKLEEINTEAFAYSCR